MLPAWTFEWCRYLWPCTQMLISMCYLGIAVGWIHCLLWGSLSLESAFDGSREWREQDRREAFCTNTSQWEHVSHQNYKKTHLGSLMKRQNKNDFEEIKEDLCIFQLQSDTNLLSYPVTTHFHTHDSRQKNEILLSSSTLLQWTAAILMLGEKLGIEWSSVTTRNCQCTV